MDSFLKTGKLGSTSGEPSSKSKKIESTKSVPWVEKYRPKTVTDVAHQEEVVSVLKTALGGADLPNLLFYGPPGTGKTSTILAAARDLFKDIWRSRILELNASDERGIAVVRDKIKTFASQSVSQSSTKGVPPFKIVILDEADSMTKDAQSALRRTMEKQGKSTRFCLVCNYISRIIDPITSRCAKFRFKSLSNDAIRTRLEMVCTEEKLQVKDDESMEALIESSEGDMRKAITTLQSCSRLNKVISKREIYEVSGRIPAIWIDDLFHKIGPSGSFEKLNRFAKDLTAEGFSLTQYILQLHEKVVFDETIPDSKKAAICEKLAVAEGRLHDGANEYLQILDVTTLIMNQMANSSA